MTEEWSENPAVGGASEPLEIKLFGRWSSSDVQVSDISLTVSNKRDKNMLERNLTNEMILGLHRGEGEICAISASFVRSICVKAIP